MLKTGFTVFESLLINCVTSYLDSNIYIYRERVVYIIICQLFIDAQINMKFQLLIKSEMMRSIDTSCFKILRSYLYLANKC